MKKKIVSRVMMVLLLSVIFCLSSCVMLTSALIADGRHLSKVKKEAAITGGNSVNWRNEFTYDERNNKKFDSTGSWYMGDIHMVMANLSADSEFKGISILYIMYNWSYHSELTLMAIDDKPAGEVSSFTVKKMGDAGNTTWTLKYILSTDGSSFNIVDLGGLNSPPLRTGRYISSERNKAVVAAALEGYGSYTIRNMSTNHSIIKIDINDGKNRGFSKTYQVNLHPSTGILGGGSFEIGEIVSGKKVVPIGDYELILYWSNGAQTTDKLTITNGRGVTGNYNQ